MDKQKLNILLTAPTVATLVNYVYEIYWQLAVRRDNVISITFH